MNREEFLAQLKSLLTGISEEERDEALQYYIDYFEDAGPEHEAEVLQELGSPEKIAAMIKADLKGNNTDSGEFTEWGYTDERFEEKESPACREAGRRWYKKAENRYSYNKSAGEQKFHPGGDKAGYSETEAKRTRPYTNNWLKILLIILIIVVAVPAVIPVAAAVIAVIFAFLGVLFGLFIGFVIAALAVTVSGFCMVVAGIVRFFVMPPSALMSVGIGLLLLGFGLAATAASIKLCFVIYPAMCRFFVNICRRPFHRKVVS